MNSNPRYKMKDFWKVMEGEVRGFLQEKGQTIFPTHEQCKTRYFTMMKSYKDTMDHNRKSGNDRRTCKYFAELDEINGECPNMDPVATLSVSGRGDFGISNKRKKASSGPSSSSTSAAADNNVADSSEDEDEEGPSKKKRKYVTGAEKSTQSILLWLDTYAKKVDERELSCMRMQQQMHKEKMELFSKLIHKL